MPKLLDLPPELQRLIAEEVAVGDEPGPWDRKSLQSLRPTCKAMYAASINVFGTAFFTKRKHVISGYSIEELLTITEHWAFGPCVQNIQIEAVCKEVVDADVHPLVNRDVFVWSGGFCGVMQQIFENIKSFGNKVTVGVCASELGSFGRKRLGVDKSAFYPVTETLAQVLEVTKLSKVTIRALLIELRDAEYMDPLVGRGEVNALKETVAECLATKIDDHLTFKFAEGQDCYDSISYDADKQLLELHGDLIQLEEDCSDYVFDKWVPSRPVRRLDISDCELEGTGEEIIARYLEPFDALEEIRFNSVLLNEDPDWSVDMEGGVDQYETDLPGGCNIFVAEGDAVTPGLREIAVFSEGSAAASRP